MSAPPGLSIREVFAANPCQWVIFSKAKTGPRRVWACQACGKVAKNADRKCPGGLADRPKSTETA